ncbi:MBL fold metallo-hydrolase [Allohahella marinimesophila]|uniref:Metallo-beta-lactamase domain-containing protein n=1 Tax=Allohahella marinimesophila TaxID=1054972 RepID=A0ABP7PGR8_9GAMM
MQNSIVRQNATLITVMNVVLGGALAMASISTAQAAETVKVTPLGSHEGEFCGRDRALIFEDPDGTRILYDVGQTVTGVNDKRLGKIDVVLVSHMHGDHVGDRHMKTQNAGSCAKPEISEAALPETLSVKIAAAKKAKIITGSEMPKFFGAKLKSVGASAEDAVLVRFGGSVTHGGVKFTTVPATHSNGVAPGMIGGSLGDTMEAAGISAYVGPPTGYVITFSNGLVAYLSGDTGIIAEQKTTVQDHYEAQLVVMNIGDTYTTGPKEAAYVINELIEPGAVIASHANEAATDGGKVREGTKTEAFMKASEVLVHLPLSGRTMAFDKTGKCVDGCN